MDNQPANGYKPKKTKAMIINFTNNHQFTTRLQLKGETVEIVESMKSLGVIVTNKLDWYENMALLAKKSQHENAITESCP